MGLELQRQLNTQTQREVLPVQPAAGHHAFESQKFQREHCAPSHRGLAVEATRVFQALVPQAGRGPLGAGCAREACAGRPSKALGQAQASAGHSSAGWEQSSMWPLPRGCLVQGQRPR